MLLILREDLRNILEGVGPSQKIKLHPLVTLVNIVNTTQNLKKFKLRFIAGTALIRMHQKRDFIISLNNLLL